MLTPYERYLVVLYLFNISKHVQSEEQISLSLVRWIGRQTWIHGYDKKMNRIFSRLNGVLKKEKKSSSKRRLRRLCQSLKDEGKRMQTTKLDTTALRIRNLAEAAGLESIDVEILESWLRRRSQPIFSSLLYAVFGENRRYNSNSISDTERIAVLLGRAHTSVYRRFARDAPLTRSGLLTMDNSGDLLLPYRLNRLCFAPDVEGLDVKGLLLDTAVSSGLQWSDFDHVSEGRDHVERLIKGALQNRETGVNVLLYGPPGTGKTEFCRVLAERLGTTLFTVGETDIDDIEDEEIHSTKARMQELRVAQRLLSANSQALLLFDEMEDLLAKPSGGSTDAGQYSFSSAHYQGSKIYMHHVLERTPVPTLWAMNDADCVSEAILRRMMFALELHTPTEAVRARIWARQLEQNKIEAELHDVNLLARDFTASPGIAAGATAAARISNGGIETVRRGVRGLSKVLGRNETPRLSTRNFDAGLVRSDIEVTGLIESLMARDHSNFSLCIQGPPGTGKSAFVRHLAECLGLEVTQKRTSDLVRSFVGETEQLIARAFAEARESGTFLVFDEADSLLADRRLAYRNYEISEVNEMLTQMESHPFPFACTTNFFEHLDVATLRRFVFKISFDYLTPEQTNRAFAEFFDVEAPRCITELKFLTPGDFAVVHKRARILGQLNEPEALVSMLKAECAAKPGSRHPLGFSKSN